MDRSTNRTFPGLLCSRTVRQTVSFFRSISLRTAERRRRLDGAEPCSSSTQSLLGKHLPKARLLLPFFFFLKSKLYRRENHLFTANAWCLCFETNGKIGRCPKQLGRDNCCHISIAFLAGPSTSLFPRTYFLRSRKNFCQSNTLTNCSLGG